jgi:glutamate-1-semialdehyde 2,1-aminomutase
MGEALRRGLAGAAQRAGQAMHVLGDGPIVQPFFLDGPEPLSHEDLRRADPVKSMKFSLGLISRGIFINPGGKFYLSLAHTNSDIDAALEAAESSIIAIDKA